MCGCTGGVSTPRRQAFASHLAGLSAHGDRLTGCSAVSVTGEPCTGIFDRLAFVPL